MGMIAGIKRFEIHDGDGIRTTLFLKGCPLSCRWCHNPECIMTKPVLSFLQHRCLNCGACADVCGAHAMAGGEHIYDRSKCVCCGECEKVCAGGALRLYGTEATAEELLPKLLEDRPFYETSGGGVTVSGGEPLMQAAFTAEILRLLKGEGIDTAVDTCGYAPWEALEAVVPWTDTFLYDIKAIDEQTHVRCTGKTNAPILDNLKFLDAIGKRIEVRVPFIPGWNDGEIRKIGAFLSGLTNVSCVKLLPYHNYAKTKYDAIGEGERFTEIALPSAESAAEATAILSSFGLNAKVAGR